MTDQKIQRVKEKLKEIQASSLEGGIEAHIKKMEEEIKTNKFILDNQPKEIEQKKQWVEKLRKVLNDANLTEGERAKMQSSIQALKNEVKQLTIKRDAGAK